MDNIIPEKMRTVKVDGEDVLGKLLYFGLADILIEREKLIEICSDMNLPVNVGTRSSEVDSFKSATSDVCDRIIDSENGELRVRKVYCRDNDKSENIVSRELICETLGQNTNKYHKLANLYYNKYNRELDYTIEDYGSDLNIDEYCHNAVELFELYKRCIGRSQLENLTENFMDSMEALKINVHGKIYFVPRKHIEMVDVFEDFIIVINAHNKRAGQLTVNSFFVADDDKQRGKMAAEFYRSARQEINSYIEKLETFISKDSSNLVLLERWITKANTLDAKKRDYETLLKSELNEIDDDYQTLRLLVQELNVRANKLRSDKLV